MSTEVDAEIRQAEQMIAIVWAKLEADFTAFWFRKLKRVLQASKKSTLTQLRLL